VVWGCKVKNNIIMLLELELEDRGSHFSETYLGCVVVYDFLCGQIALVADKELVDTFTSITINLLQPLLDVVEGNLVCYVINDNDAVGTTVVT
jgi:hypothetical protein